VNKKELLVPFLVIGLTVLFVGICVAVFLSNGKSKKWISRKMKIGGLLLTLTAVSCNGGNGEGVVTCYAQAMVNDFELDEAKTYDSAEVKLYSQNVMNGKIYSIQGKDFSFALIDENNKKAQFGSLIITDGKVDQTNEDFQLVLDKTLRPGNYSLNFYATRIEAQDSSYAQRTYHLVIKIE